MGQDSEGGTAHGYKTIGNISDSSLISGTPKMVLLVSTILFIFGFAVSRGSVVWLVLLRGLSAQGA
jgi:hypothetical protein